MASKRFQRRIDRILRLAGRSARCAGPSRIWPGERRRQEFSSGRPARLGYGGL